MAAEGIYTGRLVADGNGNLLADEGDYKGHPVAFHEGSFVFLKPGDASHNEQYHQNFVEPTPTQDQVEDMPGYAGTPDNPTPGAEHHWGATPDDPHYAEGERLNTKVKNDPDAVAPFLSGHTEAYKS